MFSEMGTTGSVDGAGRLVIKGRFQQKQIENVLRRYIGEYLPISIYTSGVAVFPTSLSLPPIHPILPAFHLISSPSSFHALLTQPPIQSNTSLAKPANRPKPFSPKKTGSSLCRARAVVREGPSTRSRVDTRRRLGRGVRIRRDRCTCCACWVTYSLCLLAKSSVC